MTNEPKEPAFVANTPENTSTVQSGDESALQQEMKADVFLSLSPEEQTPIIERARQLRVSPSGYGNIEALLVAIDELIPEQHN